MYECTTTKSGIDSIACYLPYVLLMTCTLYTHTHIAWGLNKQTKKNRNAGERERKSEIQCGLCISKIVAKKSLIAYTKPHTRKKKQNTPRKKWRSANCKHAPLELGNAEDAELTRISKKYYTYIYREIEFVIIIIIVFVGSLIFFFFAFRTEECVSVCTVSLFVFHLRSST